MKEYNINIRFQVIKCSRRRMTYNEAQEYCKKLGGRLPSVMELRIIFDLQKVGLVDINFEEDYWSNNNFRDYENVAYYVDSYNASVYWGDKELKCGRAMCLAKSKEDNQ